MCILFMLLIRDVRRLHLLLVHPSVSYLLTNKNLRLLRRELPGEMRMQMVTVVGVTQRWSPTDIQPAMQCKGPLLISDFDLS